MIKITQDLAEGLSKDMATTVAENYQAAYTEFFKDRFTFPFLDLQSIDLQRISSVVRTYSLTKNFDELVMKYEHTIRQYELNHAMDLRNLEV